MAQVNDFQKKPDPRRQMEMIKTGQATAPRMSLGQPKPVARPKIPTGRDRSKYGKRHTPGVMNKTESKYAELLDARIKSGAVLSWEFEACTFKIAKDCRYTADFIVVLATGVIELVDVKGGGPIDPKSLVKIKAAASKFWAFQFVIEKLEKGGWQRTEF